MIFFGIVVDISFVYVTDDVAVAVGYYCCRNSVVEIFNTVVTVNIFEYVWGTTVNVTKYVIILICIVIGVGGGGGGGG